MKVARRQGIDPFQVYVLRSYMEDHKQGTFEFGGGVSPVLEQLTGSPAESFETTARRYAALPFARQTLSNRLRACGNFMVTPFVPGYNLTRYAREHEFPVPPVPQLCMESAQWQAEHCLPVEDGSWQPERTPQLLHQRD